MVGDDSALTILLVEDNDGDANLVQHHLRRGSFPDVPDRQDLTRVESLDGAVEAVSDERFDVVLLDLGLQESRGIETLDDFLPEAPDTPVIVLTGLDDKETAVEAIQQGAQDYLPKDHLDTESLMRSVRYAIERKKQERALRRQTEQLKFFNSVLRHDVSNGMEVIRRNAQLLADDVDGNSLTRAETILDWSDDIIDLTQKVRRMLDATTGDDEHSLSWVNLSAVLRERIDHVASIDERATIATDIPDDVRVLADDMLPDVLGNVLSNAIEHNDADRPRVDVSVTVTEHENTVAVEIADNGPGVPDEQKEAVFDWGETRQPDSDGFGLYFVRTMVDAYGGTVEVGDNDPSGAVFDITLQRP